MHEAPARTKEHKVYKEKYPDNFRGWSQDHMVTVAVLVRKIKLPGRVGTLLGSSKSGRVAGGSGQGLPSFFLGT